MKLSILDEILEEEFCSSLERTSPAAKKLAGEVSVLEDKIKACLSDENKKSLDQLLSTHWKLFDEEHNDRFKIGVRFGLLLCFEVFGM